MRSGRCSKAAAAVVGAALLVAACTSGDTSTGGTPSPTPAEAFESSYHSPDGMLTFRYPGDWTIDTESAGPGAWFLTNFALEPGGGHLRDGMAKIDFLQEAAEGATLEDLRADLCLEDDPRQEDELAVLDCSTIDLGGVDWVRAEVDDGSFGSRNVGVATVAGETIYRAIAFVPDGEEQAGLLETVGAIFATLRVEQPAG